MEWRHPSIIAMKGHPFTGKTSIAFDLANRIRYCTLISLDDILDSISSPYSSSSPPPPHEADRLTRHAFDILCRVAQTQLRLGISVIIDSQLSSQHQLDRLLHLSSTTNAAKFVIVECRISKIVTWQARFEKERLTNVRPVRWHKARSWEEVTELIESYDKCLEEPINGVSRLVINFEEEVRGVVLFWAVHELVSCENDRHLNLDEWLAECQDPSKLQGLIQLLSQEGQLCSFGHYGWVFEEVLDYNADCGACGNPVLVSAYACVLCHLALHDSCAKMEIECRSFTPHNFSTFFIKSDPPTYSFPENHTCLRCRKAGQSFSDECSSCLYETHLKCGLVPTVIMHDGHKDHFLSFMAATVSSREHYNCDTCGMEGICIAYGCHVCGKYYHVECALLPYPLTHKHGGYEHPLEMRFSRDQEQEDYPCDFCLEMMNPQDWYYHCPKCYQTYHLHCAFEDN